MDTARIRSKLQTAMCSLVLWKTVLVFVSMSCLVDVCSGLSCYQCSNEASNFMCIGEENYAPCDEGMDTCQTIVSYLEVSTKLEITKTCTKNLSCELQINATMRRYPCDSSKSSWICTSCCYGDGCNVDGVIATHVTSWVGLLAGSLAAYVIANVCGRLDNWTCGGHT